MEMKIIMSRLLQTFVFQLTENYKLKMIQKLTLQPSDEVFCTVRCVSE